ncbi:MAG: hypothetical protein H6586_00335 [Flavobacteriales bacterium]|nr:hypothetical protein [Flavobacteriales bacterium]
MLLDAKDFQRVSLHSKIKHLQQHGIYITKRNYLRYEIWLYHYNGYFVEVWRTLSFGDIYSIDIAPERSVKESYLDAINLDELGLEV